jgi:hypothetical protein
MPSAQARDDGPLTHRIAQKFQVADDLEIEQVLADQPSHNLFSTSTSEGACGSCNRQYPSPAGLKMLSRDNVWRAVYDKFRRRRRIISVARIRSRFTRTPTATGSSIRTRPLLKV